jgi:hypothetical protein
MPVPDRGGFKFVFQVPSLFLIMALHVLSFAYVRHSQLVHTFIPLHEGNHGIWSYKRKRLTR